MAELDYHNCETFAPAYPPAELRCGSFETNTSPLNRNVVLVTVLVVLEPLDGHRVAFADRGGASCHERQWRRLSADIDPPSSALTVYP